MIKLVISGCCGRMGQEIARRALADERFALSAVFERPNHPAVGHDYRDGSGELTAARLKVLGNAQEAMSLADVVIEFTSPEATVEHVHLAAEVNKPIVVGTTGLSEEQVAVLKGAAKTTPVLYSPNMSLGINVLYELAQLAAERLGGAFYDVEIIESHHREKKDAPSGTAKRLRERLVAIQTVRRPEIPIHSIRAGDIVGDHTVVLAGPSERLELTHRAHGREVFARGALTAARFLVKQKPGLYDMSHVLKAATD